MSRPGLGLHVGTAVAGVLVINVLALSLGDMKAVFVAAVLVSVAFASLRRPAAWLGVTAFLTTMALLFLSEPLHQGPWALASSVGYWLLRLGVSAFAAIYLVLSVTPTDFVAALHRARIPGFVSLPATVMLRFLPQARQEFRAVTEAMALRGIPLGAGDWVRHPLRTVEYVVVPLLVSCSRLADDLTASGLVRGLGGGGRSTPLVALPLTRRDVLATAVLAALLWAALAPGGPLR